MKLKFKYKKIILFTLVSTMGIGVVTLSIIPNKNNKAQESINLTQNKLSTEISPTQTLSESTITAALTPTLAVTPMPTPSPIPTPTPLPIYELETEGYPNITDLIENYYDAKLDCNVNRLKTLLSDPSNVSSKKQLKKDIQFIEEYKKIKCYVKKGFQEGTYIVFVYNELKFFNIKTPAPAADQFYIITDKEGNLKIFSGEFDSASKKYYNDRLDDEDVQTLIANTNEKAEKAKAKDKALKIFWDKLAN